MNKPIEDINIQTKEAHQNSEEPIKTSGVFKDFFGNYNDVSSISFSKYSKKQLSSI
jgi:hypothetical protein